MFCYGEEVKRNSVIILAIGLIAGAFAAYFIFNTTNNSSLLSTGKNAEISGRFDVNGVIPQGVTITLLQRDPSQKGGYTAIAQGLQFEDQATWNFPNAVSGKSYEIKASVVQDGKTLSESDPIFVTAPATDEAIGINVESQNGTANAVISGIVGINGYLPTGSTITIEGKLTNGSADYTKIISGVPAKDGQVVAYTTAVAGKTYSVRGTLYDGNGGEIGKSSVLQITAPAKNEVLDINSTAKAPVVVQPTAQPAAATAAPVVSNGTISGSINFNGGAPANSRIVIFQRLSGQGNFQVAVDNITPVNGTNWQWNGAQVGTWYDMVAILKQKQSNGTDTDIATSSTQTFAAPASNEVFTLNSGFSLSSPNGNITITCGNNNNNVFSAIVYFQSVPNAQGYWYQVGMTNGGAELYNQTGNGTSNPLQQINVSMNRGTNYYARYAYSTIGNQPMGSSQYSGFTGTTQISCN